MLNKYFSPMKLCYLSYIDFMRIIVEYSWSLVNKKVCMDHLCYWEFNHEWYLLLVSTSISISYFELVFVNLQNLLFNGI